LSISAACILAPFAASALSAAEPLAFEVQTTVAYQELNPKYCWFHPRAAAIVGTLSALYGMVQHLNVRTPRWLALIVQRPEAHCLHHERGVHARNYSDLPLWDWVFGTYANPRTFAGDVGFDAPADRRIAAMLGFRDVNGPAAPLGQRPDARA
jgi:sterol desaturase/sphingolipid hydroxylase (fatty acid hydroxylase superfamily)